MSALMSNIVDSFLYNILLFALIASTIICIILVFMYNFSTVPDKQRHLNGIIDKVNSGSGYNQTNITSAQNELDSVKYSAFVLNILTPVLFVVTAVASGFKYKYHDPNAE